jgi:hypothetical protein
MPNTTPYFAPLESIDTALLLLVSGGCHKKRCCPAPAQPAVMQQQVMQQPAQQMLPQAPAAPAAQPGAPDASAMPMPGGGGDIIMTSVSINGQPVGGTGQPATA